MPSTQTAEVLAELGLIAGVLVFLIMLAIMLTLMVVEEIMLHGKKMYIFFLIRQQNK